MAFLKSKPSGREIYAAHPLFPGGGDPDTRRGLLKPLYGSAAACKEWAKSLRHTPMSIGATAGVLDKSVSSGEANPLIMASEKILGQMYWE